MIKEGQWGSGSGTERHDEEREDVKDRMNGIFNGIRDGDFPSEIEPKVMSLAEKLYFIGASDTPYAIERLKELYDYVNGFPADKINRFIFIDKEVGKKISMQEYIRSQIKLLEKPAKKPAEKQEKKVA